MEGTRKTVMVGTHLQRGEFERFRELCYSEGSLLSEVLRRLCLKYLKEKENMIVVKR